MTSASAAARRADWTVATAAASMTAGPVGAAGSAASDDGGSVGAATVVAEESAATAEGHAAEDVGASRRAMRPSVSRSTERERPCMSSAVMYLWWVEGCGAG